MVPPIKSQGIKTKLIPFISTLVPSSQSGRWIEPFMGTGVVGFNLADGPALMSDTNPHLVRFYDAIKSGDITGGIVREFLSVEGDRLQRSDGAYYYEVRARFNADANPLDFLFLTRACFNGVMRFNRSGHFNVPFCKKPARFSQAYVTKIVNQVDAVSQVVRSGHFDFRVSNFRRILDEARSGDLIYCDPPYIARHADYFNSWSEDDERALADGLRMTSASFILSTWSHNDYRMNDYIDSFWGDFPRITREHFYHVGARESNRRGITEALVFSSDLDPREFVPSSAG
ncbi:Dam family site-specific DNA-(adenine-N6)-methyltransferase [Actinomyces bouchesdurhonensis]|uniref:Dam family site-specific DNA-(adenine-N6)-methyltransferase n=1 Tax=Actinomyces bouchesdurhonensis TaxID=1852361 RepID=UPI00190EAC86|nr:Dam family site-specific DNA-(adenine-N6)-methyltransferase [Actinomyces bouchesdurhonensis]